MIDKTDPNRFLDAVKCTRLPGTNACRLTYADGETEMVFRAYLVSTIERLGHHQAAEFRAKLIPARRPTQ